MTKLAVQISPNFSLRTNHNKSMKIWRTYRTNFKIKPTVVATISSNSRRQRKRSLNGDCSASSSEISDQLANIEINDESTTEEMEIDNRSFDLPDLDDIWGKENLSFEIIPKQKFLLQ